jgi:hypothetical protein
MLRLLASKMGVGVRENEYLWSAEMSAGSQLAGALTSRNV